MTTAADQIFNDAMTLGNDERIALAEKLIGSIVSDQEIFEAHLAVGQRRLDELLSGKVKPISREELKKLIQQSLRENSAS
jgi:putative addiction module component (TIGR02574 family)